MMKYFAAVALASIALAAFAHPASAVTFPSLTTIYVGSGVVDSGDAPGQGVATSIHCSNVSGIAAQVRVLVLGAVGTVRVCGPRLWLTAQR